MRAYKLVVVGDSGVGKTSFVSRLCNGSFTRKHIPTDGVSVVEFDHFSDEQTHFSIWDVAGSKHVGIADGYYIQADCAIIIVDMTKSNPFANTNNHIRDIRRICDNPRFPIVIVCNKTDQVSVPCPFKYRKHNSLYPVIDASAKSGYNLERPLSCLVQQINKQRLKSH